MTEPRPTLVELAGHILRRLPLLLRKELSLAQAELAENLLDKARNAALLAFAAFLGLVASALLIGGAVAALALVLQVWAAFLVVAAVVLAVAAGMVVVGLRRLRQGQIPPRQALGEVVESKEWLGRRVRQLKEALKPHGAEESEPGGNEDDREVEHDEPGRRAQG